MQCSRYEMHEEFKLKQILFGPLMKVVYSRICGLDFNLTSTHIQSVNELETLRLWRKQV